MFEKFIMYENSTNWFEANEGEWYFSMHTKCLTSCQIGIRCLKCSSAREANWWKYCRKKTVEMRENFGKSRWFAWCVDGYWLSRQFINSVNCWKTQLQLRNRRYTIGEITVTIPDRRFLYKKMPLPNVPFDALHAIFVFYSSLPKYNLFSDEIYCFKYQSLKIYLRFQFKDVFKYSLWRLAIEYEVREIFRGRIVSFCYADIVYVSTTTIFLYVFQKIVKIDVTIR